MHHLQDIPGHLFDQKLLVVILEKLVELTWHKRQAQKAYQLPVR